MNPTFSLLFGGMSFEHEISIISAITIKNILKDHIKHFIFLDSSHHFYLIFVPCAAAERPRSWRG